MLKYLKDHSKLLVVAISVIVLGFVWFSHDTQESTTDGILKTKEIKSNTQVTIVPKQSQGDSDLVLNNNYVATINGETFKVPVSTNTASSLKDNTAIVDSSIDITPLLKRLQPSWEVGTGVGVHNSQVYFPVSVQRNYKADKAIQVEVHLGTDGSLKGTEVQHKWFFR